MKDHRIERGGTRLDYTCGNVRYQTNIDAGETHADRATSRGSVFREPLVRNQNDDTLWLEHVSDIREGGNYYWLMWYDSSGCPTIPMSGIFGPDEIPNMRRLLADFAPPQ